MTTGCIQPDWRIRVNFTALGSPGYEERNTVKECLDYCAEDLNCVGVDVDWDLNPKRCWPHSDETDFREDNIYSQPGTTSYELLDRCVTTQRPSSTTRL